MALVTLTGHLTHDTRRSGQIAVIVSLMGAVSCSRTASHLWSESRTLASTPGTMCTYGTAPQTPILAMLLQVHPVSSCMHGGVLS